MGGAVLGLEEQMGALGDIPSTQGDETQALIGTK